MANILQKKTESVNTVTPSVDRKSNTYDLSHMRFFTSRFGEYTPFDCTDTIHLDRYKCSAMQQTRVYTLKAPTMFPITNNRDYFFVPITAYMPKNYEKFVVSPQRGDDLPKDAFPYLRPSFLLSFLKQARTNLGLSTATTWQQFIKGLHLFRFMESFCSQGSLLACLGLKTCLMFEDSNDNLEDYFGIRYQTLFQKVKRISYKFDYPTSLKSDIVPELPFSRLFAVIFNNDEALTSFEVQGTTISELCQTLDDMFDSLINIISGQQSQITEDSVANRFSLERLIAYNIVCNEFYTNDRIDNIFNTERFWDACYSSQNNVRYYFDYNGVQTEYDFFSNHSMEKYLTSCASLFSTTVLYEEYFQRFSFFLDLVSFKNVLRYMDYFTSANTQPTAVGDVSIPIEGETVDASNVVYGLNMRRFVNLINHVGQRLEKYRQKVFGVSTPPDKHYPRFISHSENSLGTNEVENTTSSDQGKVVTNIKSYNRGKNKDSRFDDYGIFIGINYHTLPLCYSTAVDRQIFAIDRYEKYNRMFVGIGDQPIYQCEYNNIFPTDKNFGYQPRYAEYRQAISTISGGFLRHLPGYAMNSSRIWRPLSGVAFDPNKVVDSEFIRWIPNDFDQFYSSLTGCGLSSYFHFINLFVIYNYASRNVPHHAGILNM